MFENISLVFFIILTPSVGLILFTLFKGDKKEKEKWKTNYRAKDPDYEKEQAVINEKNLNQPKEYKGTRGGKFYKKKSEKTDEKYRKYF